MSVSLSFAPKPLLPPPHRASPPSTISLCAGAVLALLQRALGAFHASAVLALLQRASAALHPARAAAFLPPQSSHLAADLLPARVAALIFLGLRTSLQASTRPSSSQTPPPHSSPYEPSSRRPALETEPRPSALSRRTPATLPRSLHFFFNSGNAPVVFSSEVLKLFSS
ncbi:hypothetical protein BRADI_1g47725v3 [Brachypodium distachyon]|uniref:Uncharacterized protein n=1 Tax=Brachypodium distachyon TaxID=15368 RepID=A0A2K2DQ41_BRADI|nr:hypothetical protein BRADI_1g47725v3 [Brachypodium distachyon]